MARLTSAIYNANPGIFKTGDKFNIDSSAIKASVLKSTGLKPATVSVNGRNAVSYTHLDVYKRQVLRLVTFLQKQQKVVISP